MDDNLNDNIMGYDEFISELADRAHFTKEDVRIIMREIIGIFQDAVKQKIKIKLKGFGILYTQDIPERIVTKGLKAGSTFPPTTRVLFRLAQNIRRNDKY